MFQGAFSSEVSDARAGRLTPGKILEAASNVRMHDPGITTKNQNVRRKSENQMVRVLFVCLGNICRSPAAHAVMEKLVREHGYWDQIEVDSAGTMGYHSGEPCDSRMDQELRSRGYRCTHLARRVAPGDFDKFDYVLAMDRENLSNLQRMVRGTGQESKVSLLLDHCADAGTCEVPDPYYGGRRGFEQVVDLVEKGCEALLEKIAADHALK